MAPLRKGTCSWTAALEEVGVEAEEEVELLPAGDVEVALEEDPANVRCKKKGMCGARARVYVPDPHCDCCSSRAAA